MILTVEVRRLPDSLIQGYGCFDNECAKAKELMESWKDMWPERYSLVTPWVVNHVRDCGACSNATLLEFLYRIETGRPPLRRG